MRHAIQGGGKIPVDASGNVPVSTSGAFISQTNLTLSASSQALPTIPAGARSVLIQVHGGTITDRAYISLDGTAATTAGLYIKNVEDTTAIGGPTELTIIGGLDDVRILGTANASTAYIAFFK